MRLLYLLGLLAFVTFALGQEHVTITGSVPAASEPIGANINWAKIYKQVNSLSYEPASLQDYHPDLLNKVVSDFNDSKFVESLTALSEFFDGLNQVAAEDVDPIPQNMMYLQKALSFSIEVSHLWTQARGVELCGKNITQHIIDFVNAISKSNEYGTIEAITKLLDNLFNTDIQVCATELGLPLAEALPDILIRVSRLIGTPLQEDKIKCMKSGFDDFDRSFNTFEKQWNTDRKGALRTLSAAFSRLQQEGNRCNAPIYATIFGLLQSSLVQHANDIIGNTVSMAADVEGMIDGYKDRDWTAFMNHMGDLCGRMLPLVGCNSDGCKVASSFLNVMSIIAHDFVNCESALEDVASDFKTFAKEWEEHKYNEAMHTLELGVSGLGTALNQCGLLDISSAIGGSVEKIAKATVKFQQGKAKVILEGIDLTANILDAVVDVREKNWEKFGVHVANIVVDVLSLSCHSQYCKATIDLFRTMGTVIGDLDKCTAAINKTEVPFKDAYRNWRLHKYEHAVENVMDGIVSLGNALTDCDVSKVADLMISEGSTLKNAKITKIGNEVKVVLQEADLTVAIASLIDALLKNDAPSMGKSIAQLINSIHTANCTSSFCVLITDILTTARLLVPDLPKCESDISHVLSDFQTARRYFENGNTTRALDTVALVIDEFAEASIDCHLDDVANLLNTEGDKLKSEQLKQIANDIHLFVDGAVVYDSLYLMFDAVENFNMREMGKQLGRLLGAVKDFGCDSRACSIVTALLTTFEDVLVDLGPCQNDLDKSWTDMEKAFKSFAHGDYSVGLHDMGSGINSIAAALHKCHVPELAGDLTALVGLLKVAKLQKLDFEKGYDIIIAGASIIDDIHSLQIGAETHNDQIIARAISDILKQVVMLAKELCDDDDKTCLVGTGILKTIINIPNLTACIQDFREVYNSVVESVHDARHDKWKQAAKDLGSGIHFLSLALHDCDAEDIALALVTIAEKLGAPGLGWVSTAVKLFIDGVDLIDSFRSLVIAFESDPKNWLGVGISVGQIVRIILRDLTDIPALFGELEIPLELASQIDVEMKGSQIPQVVPRVAVNNY